MSILRPMSEESLVYQLRPGSTYGLTLPPSFNTTGNNCQRSKNVGPRSVLGCPLVIDKCFGSEKVSQGNLFSCPPCVKHCRVIKLMGIFYHFDSFKTPLKLRTWLNPGQVRLKTIHTTTIYSFYTMVSELVVYEIARQ